MGTCKTPLPSHIASNSKNIVQKRAFFSYTIPPLFAKVWRVLFENSMEHKYTLCYCSVFKNSPKYPNDAQMFNCKIDKWILPQHSNAKWSCHMIFGWSKFIKSLHLPGLNFQNSCWHMKIDRINRCFADFSSSYPLVNCWAFKWKKKKENDFQKIFKASFKLIFFFFPQSFQSLATYL